MMASFAVAPTMSILLLLVLAAIGLAGLLGLVLLIVGLAKRWAAMWVGGIVVMVVAGLALMAGVVAAAVIVPRACTPSSGAQSTARGGGIHAPGAGPAEGGNYIRSSDGRTTARAEGVDFEILKPSGGGTTFGTHTTFRNGRSESTHTITAGEVVIVVRKTDGHMDLEVGGTYYGVVQRGDFVVIDEARKVTVNGHRRGPSQE